MDRRLIWTGLALGSVVAIALTFAGLPEKQEVIPMQDTVSDVQLAERSQPQGTGYAYTLREHGGRIAVFTAGREEPEMVLDVLVKYLPDADREELARGIMVRDYSELVSRIEDYTS
jgi:hypothetical protein